MKFSGHETFHIREGWLYKGLKLLHQDANAFRRPDCHDDLGVGANMAKSIRHWLLATSLAEIEAPGRLRFTKLGELFWRYDRYFVDPFSWWILHLELVRKDYYVSTWHWFFNYFCQHRFARETCINSLSRFVASRLKRRPSPKTLERDLSTFLSSYANPVPLILELDPEESYDCPFQELELISVFTESGVYSVNFAAKTIPSEALGYCLVQSVGQDKTSQYTEFTFERVVSVKNSPVRSFCLPAPLLFELVEQASCELGSEMIDVGGLAGQRTIRYRSLSPLEWIEHYFERFSNRKTLNYAGNVEALPL